MRWKLRSNARLPYKIQFSVVMQWSHCSCTTGSGITLHIQCIFGLKEVYATSSFPSRCRRFRKEVAPDSINWKWHRTPPTGSGTGLRQLEVAPDSANWKWHRTPPTGSGTGLRQLEVAPVSANWKWHRTPPTGSGTGLRQLEVAPDSANWKWHRTPPTGSGTGLRQLEMAPDSELPGWFTFYRDIST